MSAARSKYWAKAEKDRLKRLEEAYSTCVSQGTPVLFMAATSAGLLAAVKFRQPGRHLRSYGFLLAGAVVGQALDFSDNHFFRCHDQYQAMTEFVALTSQKYRDSD